MFEVKLTVDVSDRVFTLFDELRGAIERGGYSPPSTCSSVNTITPSANDALAEYVAETGDIDYKATTLNVCRGTSLTIGEVINAVGGKGMGPKDGPGMGGKGKGPRH
mgnify:CR=1 FL=1